MKWLLLAIAVLFPNEESNDQRAAPARWSGGLADHIPLPERGVCPGGFEPWTYDRKRAAICVRRA